MDSLHHKSIGCQFSTAKFAEYLGQFCNLTTFCSLILAASINNFQCMGPGQTLWNVRLLQLKKLFAVALTISFTLAPLGTAFAQDAGTDTVATDTGGNAPPTDTVTPPPPPDFSIPGVDTGTPSSGTDSSAPSASDVSAPPPSDTGTQAVSTPTDTSDSSADASKTTADQKSQNPLTPSPPPPPDPTGQLSSIFTSQNTKPKADGSTGALIQNLKLDIPPGRNGLQPDLALQYNSQRAEDSIAGYGWTISIPYIQRLNKFGSQSLYNVCVPPS
jgi:hypothetical protein